MSGASDTLDPIASAERGIAGSKDLMASVARDLGQHQRWLAHYQLAEERRERRIRLQELIYRLKLRFRRLLRWSKRLALISLRLARSVATSLARTGARLVADAGRRTMEGVVWLRPRVYALYGTVQRWLTASWVWILSQSRILAGATVSASSTGFARLAARSRVLAIALRRSFTAFAAWTLFQVQRFALVSIRVSATTSSWLMVRSRSLAAALHVLGASALRQAARIARVGRLTRISGMWKRVASRQDRESSNLGVSKCYDS